MCNFYFQKNILTVFTNYIKLYLRCLLTTLNQSRTVCGLKEEHKQVKGM